MKNTCPKCQSNNTKSTGIILTSMPPQYQFKCMDCETIFAIRRESEVDRKDI